MVAVLGIFVKTNNLSCDLTRLKSSPYCIVMHIMYLIVKVCANEPYVSQSPSYFPTGRCSHNRFSALHTYIRLLSAANTVLVLIVYKCAALRTPEDTQKINTH